MFSSEKKHIQELLKSEDIMVPEIMEAIYHDLHRQNIKAMLEHDLINEHRTDLLVRSVAAGHSSAVEELRDFYE